MHTKVEFDFAAEVEEHRGGGGQGMLEDAAEQEEGRLERGHKESALSLQKGCDAVLEKKGGGLQRGGSARCECVRDDEARGALTDVFITKQGYKKEARCD
jgi:hypothetical protein